MTLDASLEFGEDSRTTDASAAYARLRANVIAGVFLPGEKLRINHICKQYEIGLAPVREALNRLSAEGLIVRSDHKGFAVALVSRTDLLELTQTRRWISEIALREAITHGDDTWEENIVVAFHRMTRVARFIEDKHSIPNPQWNDAHRVFHSALIAACPSRRLQIFSEQLFDEADRYRNLSAIFNKQSTADTTNDEHRAIMNAVLARDVSVAARLMNEHFQNTCDSLLAKWEEAMGRVPKGADG